MVTGVSDGPVRVTRFDLATGDRTDIRPLAEASSSVLSPDGRLLALARDGGRVRVWDVERGRWRSRSPLEAGSDVGAMAFSRDGATLAVNPEDGSVLLWDVDGHQPARRLSRGEEDDYVHLVSFSRDGSMLAVEYSGYIGLWDTRNATFLRRVGPVSGDGIQALGFSPNSELLAVDEGETVTLWRVADAQPLKQRLTGSPVSDEDAALEFSPDGALLASQTDSGVTLWHVGARQRLGATLPASASTSALAFSADGRLLASLAEGAIVVWKASSGAWLAEACRIAGRNLTRVEWVQYLGEDRYRATCPRY